MWLFCKDWQETACSTICFAGSAALPAFEGTALLHACAKATALRDGIAQVSVGGRDNFLAAESDKTMALMIDCCSETKIATALLGQVQHKSPQVRAKVASHLDSLMQGDHCMRLAGVTCMYHPTCHLDNYLTFGHTDCHDWVAARLLTVPVWPCFEGASCFVQNSQHAMRSDVCLSLSVQQ